MVSRRSRTSLAQTWIARYSSTTFNALTCASFQSCSVYYIYGQTPTHVNRRCCTIMTLSLKSEYMLGLTLESSRRYESKILNCGLKVDPYAISDGDWTREPGTLPASICHMV